MKKYAKNLITVSCAAILASQMSIAQATDNQRFLDLTPQQKKLTLKSQPIIPRAPKVDAAAYLLMDVNSGKILAAHNIDKRRPPASLTKLMTLYIISSALEQGRIKLTDKVHISKKAWQTGGSRMFVRVGEEVSVKELIHGIIVASGNDACVAMAQFIAGNEHSFADLMNQQAALLGMKNSHFTDSTGLPHKDHFSTAHDLAILARALIRDFPQDYKWYKDKWFTHNDIKQPNRNRLLWRNKYADGLKTGHTKEAGYCLVGSAKKDGMRLLTVVLGAPTDSKRTEDSQRLLTYGFRFFETRELYKAGEAISKPRVWMGDKRTTPVGLTKNLYITIPLGQSSKLNAHMKLDSHLNAPLSKGQKVGSLSVDLSGHPIVEQAIYALEDNPKGGIWTRVRDKVHLKMKQWLGTAKRKITGAE